jgi:shikimate kinase
MCRNTTRSLCLATALPFALRCKESGRDRTGRFGKSSERSRGPDHALRGATPQGVRPLNLYANIVLAHPFDFRLRHHPIERVVLLGYMCSGKSTVGESLARRLDWRFVDFDVEIERRVGESVSNMIETRGEGFFRSLEAELTEEISRERGVVLAPGGAWITQPELLQAIRPGTFSAWLRLSAEQTAERLREDPIDRPFKNLDDPVPKIERMLEEREPLYRLADLSVPADRGIEVIAFEIEQVVRGRGLNADRRSSGGD